MRDVYNNDHEQTVYTLLKRTYANGVRSTNEYMTSNDDAAYHTKSNLNITNLELLVYRQLGMAGNSDKMPRKQYRTLQAPSGKVVGLNLERLPVATT